MSRHIRYPLATICILFAVGACREARQPNKQPSSLFQSIRLTNVSQLEDILHFDREQENTTSNFAESNLESIISLIHLVKNESNESLCSQEKAEEISDYYERYGLNHLQADVRNLFLAYGQRVSGHCTRLLMDELTAVGGSDLLSQEDFDQIDRWTDENSPVARLFGKPGEHENPVVSRYLIKIMKAKKRAVRKVEEQNEERDKLLYMQTSTNGTFASIQSICRRKFKPIYDQLIVPLVTLSSIGFNYRDDSMLDLENTDPKVLQWARIVFMCEALDGVVFFETPNEPNTTKIRLLTREEVESVEGLKVFSENEEKNQIKYASKAKSSNTTHFGDQILDPNDEKLIRAIKRHREPSERLGLRLDLKLSSFVIRALKRLKFDSHIECLFSCGPGKTTNEHQEVNRFLAELKQQLDGRDKAISETKVDRFVRRPLALAFNAFVLSSFILVVLVAITSVIVVGFL